MTALFIAPASSPPPYLKMARAASVKAGFSIFQVTVTTAKVGWLVKKGKTQYTYDPNKEQEFIDFIDSHKPKIIIVNDKATLGFITKKYTSLPCCRGSVIMYRGIPCIIVDDLKKVKYMTWAGWVALMDWVKAKRWFDRKQKQEPQFTYSVCRELCHVEHLEQEAANADMLGMDIETSSTYISSIAYTVLKGKQLTTYVVPFIYTAERQSAFWCAEQEKQVWSCIKRINNNPTPKLWQNGLYDNSHMVKYQIPVRNYVVDTMHLFHSIWTEAPKRLDFIVSLFVDHYRYWKDEGVEDAKDDKDKTKLPSTTEGYEDYWRYNALDTYYMTLAAIELVRIITQEKLKWALDNYNTELGLQSGSMLLMTLRGINLDTTAQNKLVAIWDKESRTARKDLAIMCGHDFNPNSPKQVAVLLYDILRLSPIPRAPSRTTNEQYLKLLQTQHPVAEKLIETIWQVKKPANNISKYGDRKKLCLEGRFVYQISAAGTETGRLASKAGTFWLGTNAQNLPKDSRVMLVPDPGYLLFDIDYAQSDAYFTAFNSEDPTYMALMIGDKDTHCYHAAHFFKRSYEEVYQGHINGEDWVGHPVYGIRQLTKRIVYGLNYLMHPRTLYITMGKKSVIGAATALGFVDAHMWSEAKLIALCKQFSIEYFKLYPWLQITLKADILQAQQNQNKFACAFGRTRKFLGSLSDSKIEREFAAYIGQGGTAGNINKGLLTIWNERWEEKLGFQVLNQVHDSLIGQIKIESLHNIPQIQKLLENECEIKGRKFVVPTDAQVGLGWGKRLMPYTKNISYEDIIRHENSWREKFYVSC